MLWILHKISKLKSQVLTKDRPRLYFKNHLSNILQCFSLIISNCVLCLLWHILVLFYLLLIANTICFSLVYTKIQLKISCNMQYLRTMQLGLVSSMSSFYRLSDLYYHLNALMLPFLFVCWTNWQLQKICKVCDPLLYNQVFSVKYHILLKVYQVIYWKEILVNLRSNMNFFPGFFHQPRNGRNMWENLRAYLREVRGLKIDQNHRAYRLHSWSVIKYRFVLLTLCILVKNFW